MYARMPTIFTKKIDIDDEYEATSTLYSVIKADKSLV